MKIWIDKKGDIVVKVFYGYSLIKSKSWNFLLSNKRVRIREMDIISLASSLTVSSIPQDFLTIYYTEEVRYWHELRRLVRIICK